MFKFLNFFKKKLPEKEAEVPCPTTVAYYKENFEFLKKVLEKYPIKTWSKSSNEIYGERGNYTLTIFKHPEVPFDLKHDDWANHLRVDGYYSISDKQARELYDIFLLKPFQEERRHLARLKWEKFKKFEELINNS